MGTVGISFGSIILAAIVFYFVIKWAVTEGIKQGINNSMLFTDAQRQQKSDEEMEQCRITHEEIMRELLSRKYRKF